MLNLHEYLITTLFLYICFIILSLTIKPRAYNEQTCNFVNPLWMNYLEINEMKEQFVHLTTNFACCVEILCIYRKYLSESVQPPILCEYDYIGDNFTNTNIHEL